MFPVILVVEVICCLFALFFLNNTGNNIWTTIKWFMLFTVVVETGLAVTGRIFHKHNAWIINIYTPVNFWVISWAVYRLSPNSKINRPFLAGIASLFLLSFSLEIFFKGFLTYTSISNTLSDVLLLILCNRFFYLLLKQDEWIEIQRHAAFWFVTGLLLFNFCATVADLFDQPLTALFIVPGVSLYYMLYLVFNLILYGCWSFAFVCKYQETI